MIKEKPFWILWQPEYHAPPRVKFYSLAEAKECAERMAAQHETYFYILKVEGVTRPVEVKPPVEYIKIGGRK